MFKGMLVEDVTQRCHAIKKGIKGVFGSAMQKIYLLIHLIRAKAAKTAMMRIRMAAAPAIIGIPPLEDGLAKIASLDCCFPLFPPCFGFPVNRSQPRK